MATYDDLASGLNNSLGLSLADALAVRNAPVPTLLEQKNQKLAQKLSEKKTKISPEVQQPDGFLDPFASYDSGYNNNKTGLLDLAEASMYRAGGNLADVGRSVSNNLFGTQYDDSEADGWSNSQTADDKAGVSLAYRQQLQQDQDQVLHDVAGGNYWDATKSAANVAFRTAADSAATLPELAAGAVLAPVAGAGVGVIGRRIQKASETASRIAERYEEIKDNKVVSVARKGVKEAGKASVLTADIVQQQRNQFKAENGGEEPSAERLAGMTLLTLATTIWQPQIASKLFMPKLGKTTKKDGNFRERFRKEIQDIVDTSNKSVLRNLGERVVEGVKGIAAAGGAEAVQEYAQFWAETLGTKMKPDEVTGFFESAANLFADEGIRDQALQSAFLGGAAGGATKASIDTPLAIAGTAADTTLSVSNKVQRKIQERTNSAMSDTDLLAATAEDKARKRAAESYERQAENAAVVLNESSTIDSVTDETVLEELVAAAGDKDLNDPDVFKSVKDRVIGDLKSKAATAKIAAKTGRAVGVGKRAAAEVAERAKKLAEEVLTPERIEQIQGLAEDTKKKLVSEFENIPQSTTLGLLRAAGKVTKESADKITRASLTELRKQAQAAGIDASTKIADILEKDGNAPDVVKALRESVRKQEAAGKAAGTVSDKLTTANNLPSKIKSVVSIGKINANNIDAVMTDVYDVTKGQFDSEATVNTVRKAIKNVVKSEQFKSLPKDEQQAFLALDSNLKRKAGPAARTDSEKVVKKVKKAADQVKQKIDDTFELVPSKKGSTSSSIGSAAAKAINTAFVKFINYGKDKDNGIKLITDQRNASEKAIAVRENPEDSKSKVIASFEPNQLLNALSQQIVSSAAKNEVEGTDTHVDEVLSHMLGPILPKIASTLGSTDPRVTAAVITHLLGKHATPERTAKIRKATNAAIGKKESDTKPTVNEDGTVTIDEDTNTSSLKGKTLAVRMDGERLEVVEVTDPDKKSEVSSLITICP